MLAILYLCLLIDTKQSASPVHCNYSIQVLTEHLSLVLTVAATVCVGTLLIFQPTHCILLFLLGKGGLSVWKGRSRHDREGLRIGVRSAWKKIVRKECGQRDREGYLL